VGATKRSILTLIEHQDRAVAYSPNDNNVIPRKTTPHSGVPSVEKLKYVIKMKQVIILKRFRQAKTDGTMVSEYPHPRMVPTIAGLMSGGRKDPD
jgi:hypothetical protein